MATPNLSEIAATTMRNRSRMLADNVLENNALLARLKARGKVKPADGGEIILQELSFAENSTYKRYSGYEVLNIQPSEVITAAEYDWKQIAVAVTISGAEQMKNSGRSKSLDLLESRVEVAEATMMNGMSERRLFGRHGRRREADQRASDARCGFAFHRHGWRDQPRDVLVLAQPDHDRHHERQHRGEDGGGVGQAGPGHGQVRSDRVRQRHVHAATGARSRRNSVLPEHGQRSGRVHVAQVQHRRRGVGRWLQRLGARHAHVLH